MSINSPDASPCRPCARLAIPASMVLLLAISSEIRSGIIGCTETDDPEQCVCADEHAAMVSEINNAVYVGGGGCAGSGTVDPYADLPDVCPADSADTDGSLLCPEQNACAETDECFDEIDNDCDGSVDECGDGVMSEATQSNVENSPYADYGGAVVDGRHTTLNVGVEAGCVNGVYFDVAAFAPNTPNFTPTCEGSFVLNTIPVISPDGAYSTLIAIDPNTGASLSFSTPDDSTSEHSVRECDVEVSSQLDAHALETSLIFGNPVDIPCGDESYLAPGKPLTFPDATGTLAVRSFLNPNIE